MLKGDTVTVIWEDVEVGRDEFNAPITETRTEDVENVLIAPGARQDVSEANRPEGVVVAWELHFPKKFTESLRGALVQVPGDEPRKVIGDPRPYQAQNTPTDWNRPVELEGHDG